MVFEGKRRFVALALLSIGIHPASLSAQQPDAEAGRFV